MEFAFTQDQLAINEAARDLLVDTCTPADLRRLLTDKATYDESRWTAIREMGLLGLLAPEGLGGMGLELVDLVGIAEAAGYVALPEPLIESAGVAIPLLSELGELERIADVLAGRPVAIGYPGRAFVPEADMAKTLLLSHGDSIHLVDAADVKLLRQKSIDPFRRLFSVNWTDSQSTARDATWETTMDRGAVLAAAQLVGLAQRSIDLAVEYAKQRIQFGKPIGSYQAVKHLIANAQVKIEFARPVVHAAAVEYRLGTPAARARVSHAKIAAGEAADLATRTAVQVHGAMGMTWEIDLHFFLKRVQALRFDWGSAAYHRARIQQRLQSVATGPDQSFASAIG